MSTSERGCGQSNPSRINPLWRTSYSSEGVATLSHVGFSERFRGCSRCMCIDCICRSNGCAKSGRLRVCKLILGLGTWEANRRRRRNIE